LTFKLKRKEFIILNGGSKLTYIIKIFNYAKID